MSLRRDECRMVVSKDFRQMFKARAYSEGKRIIELSREEAAELKKVYGGGRYRQVPFFK